MTEKISVLLIDNDAADAAAARQALLEPDTGFRLDVAEQLPAGLARLALGGVDVILLSLQLPGSPPEVALPQILKAARGVPVIVLGGEEDPQLGLEIVRAGAQDYLVKSRLTKVALTRCVRHTVERHRHMQKLLAGLRSPRSLGRVITFCGVKGGVGATTTLLNVAAALAQLKKRVLAAELLPSLGFALQMKRSRTVGSGDLLDMEAAAIDRKVLEKKLTPVPAGFQTLFGSTGAGDRVIQPAQAAAMLEAADEMADFILVDLPAQPSNIHQTVVAGSDFVVLLLEPDPLCVAYAEIVVSMFEGWGLNPASLGLVAVNRAALSNSLRPRDLKERLGSDVVGIVPSAGEGCLLAHGAGKPLVLLQPDSRYGVAINALAENLSCQPVRPLAL